MAGEQNKKSDQGAPVSPLRKEVERVSRPLLVRLSSLPKFVVPIFTIALLAIGVLAPTVIGVIALVLVLLWMGWLAYLSWPAVGTGPKLMRLATVALLAIAVVVRLVPGIVPSA